MTSLKEEIFTSLKRGVMYQLKIGHRGCYIIKRYESPLLREKKTPILREKKSSRSTPLQDVFKTSSWRFCLPGKSTYFYSRVFLIGDFYINMGEILENFIIRRIKSTLKMNHNIQAEIEALDREIDRLRQQISNSRGNIDYFRAEVQRLESDRERLRRYG